MCTQFVFNFIGVYIHVFHSLSHFGQHALLVIFSQIIPNRVVMVLSRGYKKNTSEEIQMSTADINMENVRIFSMSSFYPSPIGPILVLIENCIFPSYLTSKWTQKISTS